MQSQFADIIQTAVRNENMHIVRNAPNVRLRLIDLEAKKIHISCAENGKRLKACEFERKTTCKINTARANTKLADIIRNRGRNRFPLVFDST